MKLILVLCFIGTFGIVAHGTPRYRHPADYDYVNNYDYSHPGYYGYDADYDDYDDSDDAEKAQIQQNPQISNSDDYSDSSSVEPDEEDDRFYKRPNRYQAYCKKYKRFSHDPTYQKYCGKPKPARPLFLIDPRFDPSFNQDYQPTNKVKKGFRITERFADNTYRADRDRLLAIDQKDTSRVEKVDEGTKKTVEGFDQFLKHRGYIGGATANPISPSTKGVDQAIKVPHKSYEGEIKNKKHVETVEGYKNRQVEGRDRHIKGTDKLKENLAGRYGFYDKRYLEY